MREGRAGQHLSLVSYGVVPAVCASVASPLKSKVITLGLSWLVLGIGIPAVITRGFKTAPPKTTATEKATVEAVA